MHGTSFVRSGVIALTAVIASVSQSVSAQMSHYDGLAAIPFKDGYVEMQNDKPCLTNYSFSARFRPICGRSPLSICMA